MLLLSPATPHIAEEIWERLGHAEGVLQAGWPGWDDRAFAVDTFEYPVQVNGKVRGRINVSAEADREALEEEALAHPDVRKWTEGKTVRKVVVVPGRLVNIAVS